MMYRLGYKRLVGESPSSLVALSLPGDVSLELGYNMLMASDVTVATVLDTTAHLSCTPIDSTGDGGHY